MDTCFAGMEGNFGFGFMRLPMICDEVDIAQTKKMVDRFLESGFAILIPHMDI